MPAVALLMTLTHSSPETIRVVNVPDDLPLETLTELVYGAFGLSGVEQGRWETGKTSPANDTVGQLFHTPGLTVNFAYGPKAWWRIRVETLGEVTEGMPAPLLIEATGPDAVESCEGPEEMTRLRTAVRDLLASLDRRPSVSLATYRHLPHLAPHQMLQRLTTVDPVAVAERLVHIVPPRFPAEEEELSFDDLVEGPLGEEAPADVRAFLDFVDTRPDLQDILEDDPDPTSNPELQRALEDFFGTTETGAGMELSWTKDLPELDEQAAELVTEPVRWLLDLIGERRPLTQSGYLKPADVEAIAQHIEAHKYWFGKMNREADTLPVLVLREAMVHFQLLEVQGNHISVTDRGRHLKDRPLALAQHIAGLLPLVHSTHEVAPMIATLRGWAGVAQDGPGPGLFRPRAYADNLHLFFAMNVLERVDGLSHVDRMTEAGRAFAGEIFRRA